MTGQASGLVKPYWVRVGTGGLPIKSERDLVKFFFKEDIDDRSLELVTVNKFGSSKSPPPYWTPEIISQIAKAGGLLLIPGTWPEPSGPVYEHMRPFKPQITPCEAGETEAKKGYVYVVQPGETPSDVAIRFGQPYDGWVALRQANHDDPGGFTKPAPDNGACTFAQWGAGKRVKIPAKWPDPPRSNQIWRNIEQFTLAARDEPDVVEVFERVFDDRMNGALAAPRKDETMHVRPYIVQKGDTPGTLAGRQGVDKEDLFRANPRLTVVKDRHGERSFYKDHFRVGQRINIPVTAQGIVGEAQSGNVGCGAGGGNPFVQKGNVGYFTQTPCAQCGACGAPCGCTAAPARPASSRSSIVQDARAQAALKKWGWGSPGGEVVITPGTAAGCGMCGAPSGCGHTPAPQWGASMRRIEEARQGCDCCAEVVAAGAPGCACGTTGCNGACGNVGAMRMRQATRPAVRRASAPRPQLTGVAWDRPQPGWVNQQGMPAGSALAYWSMRVKAYAESCTNVFNSSDGWSMLYNWLRSFPSPEAFVQKYGWSQVGSPQIYSIPGMWYVNPQHQVVAYKAAQDFCFFDVGARGNVGAMQFRPAAYGIRRVPMILASQVVSAWDQKHPNWNGSNIAYWSMRIEKLIEFNANYPATASLFEPCWQAIQTGQGRARILAWLRSFESPAVFVATVSAMSNAGGPVITLVPPGLWFANEQDKHIASYASRFVLPYCTGPTSSGGQVGCGKGSSGGSGTYGMAQFGGVAGFNRLLNRVAPQQVVQMQQRIPGGKMRIEGGMEGFQVQPVTWEGTHPTGAYSNVAFWVAKIHQALAFMRKASSAYDLSPLAQRIAQDPATDGKLANWLRSTWSGPIALIETFVPNHPDYTAYVWGSTPEPNANNPADLVAHHAAFSYLDRACKSVGSGWYYDMYTGECSNKALPPGQMGAPSGTVGANGDVCTPSGAAITAVKDYLYVVQQDDLANFWKIPQKFNMPTQIAGGWTWHQLRNANLDWFGGFVLQNTACVLNGLQAGDRLRIPASWREPKQGVEIVYPGTGDKCGAGQIELGGQCVNLPPGVTVPTGGSCPAGTTNIGGLCIPNNGYTPVPGQGCLPGTTMGTSGRCEIPGGGPGPVVPGIPPVNGNCPPSMTKHSDGLCYAPGTAPPGITPVGLTTGKKEDEGYPTWAWALLGVGAVAGVAGVAYYAKKKKEGEGEAPVEEFDEEEVVVET